jgi:peptide-methionine (S)-S-oxide reductase
MRSSFWRALALIGALLLAHPVTAQTAAPSADGRAVATFAGGCFWCMEPPFAKLDGVISVFPGYMGGTTANPTYDQVARGKTGHAEVVQVTYDPVRITYQALLDTYWVNVDPVDKGGQFCDRGDAYRPEIFVHSAEQRRLAEASKAALDGSRKLGWPVVVKITDAGTFTKAEEEHQMFYKKNPRHYQRYRVGCGRDARLEALWGPATAKTH